MPWWAEAFLIAVIAIFVYLVLLKRIRRRHRPKVPPITIRSGALDKDKPPKDNNGDAEE